jgi:DNA-binding transcriptional LysR family regulator
MLKEIDLSRADLNLLVLFQIVLEERHVGRAAERLNLSPSAVSHGLGRLRRLLNDPVFLRTPRGVIPTARAMDLAEPIADILARVKSVVSTAEPFDAAKSTRRFSIGAPDGVSAVFLPHLLAAVRRPAPGIDISVRQVLPAPEGRAAGRPWENALANLEASALDIVVVPLDNIPVRFAARTLYEEDFVVAMRAGHPFAEEPTLERYCGMHHLIVSLARDEHGFVDEALEERGLSRRVALAVPGFLMALAVIAETDLVAALPRQFVMMHAHRFGVVSTEAPLALPRFAIRAITTKATMMDAGVAWLFHTLEAVSHAAIGTAQKRLPP